MSRMLRLPQVLFLLVLLHYGAGTAGTAQELVFPSREAVEAARSAPLFLSDEPVEITLETDFSAIRRQDRVRGSDQRPAVLRWSGPDGSEGPVEVQIRTRGNFRLMTRNCDFPPLRLNIRTRDAEGTLFEGQDKLKLVSVCKLRQSYWEQYVLREYLAYRTFNVLTDNSYRVRLARVTYVDTSGRDDTFTRYAFIIEDDEEMAARQGARYVELSPDGQIHPALLEPNHAALVDVFQYLIGNTDWSGVAMHNMTPIQVSDGPYFTVPYDFDFSGVVNARYAIPDSSLNITRVTQRVYRGFCPDQVGRTMEPYESAFALFREKMDEIYELWSSREGLEQGVLREVTRFFDDFYRTLADPRRIDSQIMGTCRKVARD
jgi:hypothetical protein